MSQRKKERGKRKEERGKRKEATGVPYNREYIF
jgi:hypothetical protein